VTWQSAIQRDRALYELSVGQIAHHSTALPILTQWLESECILVGQNIAFDMAVICAEWPKLLPLVVRAYDQNRVTDTMIRAKLLDIAGGLYAGWLDKSGKWYKPKYSLADLARRFSKRTLVKDGWRMFYAEFRDVPIQHWVEHAREVQDKYRPEFGLAEHNLLLDPDNSEVKQRYADLKEMLTAPVERCIEYPIEDAVAALEVYECQLAHEKYLENQWEQCRAAFRAHLQSCRGLKTDPVAVERLRAATVHAHVQVQERLQVVGIVRKDGTRDLKAAAAAMISACAEEGIEVRMTPPSKKFPEGQVCLDADACAAADDPIMADYALITSYGNILSKDIPMLLAGAVVPVQSRIGLAATGRETSSGPNIYNLRGMTIETDNGDELSVRPCFVARDGWDIAQADYPALELHTLGQSCLDLFGFSKLAEMLNSGIDPHTAFAANLEEISYEEAVERAKDKGWLPRKIAKVFNFGKPGGMGDKKFVKYLANNGIDVDLKMVVAYTKLWKATFPEMVELFRAAGDACRTGSGTVDLPRSKRSRGGANYTAWCNTWFQGPGSDCTKRAAWMIMKACYVDQASPLYGSRIVAVVYDEFLVEIPRGPMQHEAAYELARLMRIGANELVPDVPFGEIEVLLMHAWHKKAEPAFDANGRLIPWEPK